MSEIKLLPCPFCGGEAKLMSFIEETGDAICINYEDELEMDCSFVHCYNCDMDFIPHTEIAREVLKAWNTRKPMQEIVERLKNKEYECDNFLRKNIDKALVDKDAMEKQRVVQNRFQAYFEAIEIIKEVGGIDG